MMLDEQRETVLVTGGTGYVAGWMILALLKAGYLVRTSVRSAEKERFVQATIQEHGGDIERLSFAYADLTADDGWPEAVRGCTYVIHTASPLSQNKKNGQDLVTPARDGTLRILKAAAVYGVRRVVQTSSLIAALPPYSHGDVKVACNESMWSSVGEKELGEYGPSKTLAEKAAWDFIETTPSRLTLTTILPGMIIGPVMTKNADGSVEFFARLLKGSLPALPRLGYCISDVRDLVDLHIKAMTLPSAANQRFMAAGEFLWLREMAQLLRDVLDEKTSKVSTRQIPDLLFRTMALFMADARYIAPMIGKRYEVDASKAKRMLQWTPRSSRSAILDCANCLIDRGLV